MREKVFRNSSARLCSLNLSLRRRLVSPIYCKLGYLQDSNAAAHSVDTGISLGSGT